MNDQIEASYNYSIDPAVACNFAEAIKKMGNGMAVALADAVSASTKQSTSIQRLARPGGSAMFGSAVGDCALGKLLKTVSDSVGVAPINKVVADAVRDHGRSAMFGGAIGDSAALGKLLKTISAEMAGSSR